MDAEFWHRRLMGGLLDRASTILAVLRRWRGGRLCVVILLAVAAVDAGTPSLDEIAGLELRDLRGTVDSLAAYSGQPVMVMVVDAKRLRTLKAWERDLRERFKGLSYLRIADVPREPPTTYERVVERLTKRVPDEVSVLIDLEGAWSTALGLDTSQPNLLLVRPDGSLAATFVGRHEPALATEVASAVRELEGAE